MPVTDWRCSLKAFLRKPRFNYPESFTELGQQLIDDNVPALNKVYEECNRLRPLNADMTEREGREAAFQQLLDGKPKTIRKAALSGYEPCKNTVARISGEAFKLRNRLADLHSKLKLAKLPEVSAQLTALENQLASTHEMATNLFYSLERHAALYKSHQEVA